jgi:hypothetical protein
MNIADILAGFLAFGLLHLRGVEGQSGWRWLFLLEVSIHLLSMLDATNTSTQGLLTLLFGLAAFILMPPGPCQTANWARGKAGWFTERQVNDLDP